MSLFHRRFSTGVENGHGNLGALYFKQILKPPSQGSKLHTPSLKIAPQNGPKPQKERIVFLLSKHPFCRFEKVSFREKNIRVSTSAFPQNCPPHKYGFHNCPVEAISSWLKKWSFCVEPINSARLASWVQRLPQINSPSPNKFQIDSIDDINDSITEALRDNYLLQKPTWFKFGDS